MNKEEKTLAKKLGFDWVKIHEKTDNVNFVTAYSIDNIKFYLEMIPKFIIHLVKNYKNIWISFLDDEAERLRIEVYALRNKRIHARHGNFEKTKHGQGGITKALEIDSNTQSKMAHVGEEKDFNAEVKKRTEPFEHLISKEEEPELESEVEGLGEVIGRVITEVEDDRREEEERT
jgi:hypothetical protein